MKSSDTNGAKNKIREEENIKYISKKGDDETTTTTDNNKHQKRCYSWLQLMMIRWRPPSSMRRRRGNIYVGKMGRCRIGIIVVRQKCVNPTSFYSFLLVFLDSFCVRFQRAVRRWRTKKFKQ